MIDQNLSASSKKEDFDSKKLRIFFQSIFRTLNSQLSPIRHFFLEKVNENAGFLDAHKN